MIDRRNALKLLGGAALTTVVNKYSTWTEDFNFQLEKVDSNNADPIQAIRARYSVSKEITNIENGYFGVMTDKVRNIYQQNIERVNAELAVFARLEFSSVIAETYSKMQTYMGVPENSTVLTRNATEALNIAIQGCELKKGDEVIISQLDYDSALACWKMLEKTKQIVLVKLQLPLFPKSADEIVDMYSKAITSKTKVVHLTHINHLTGLILPVKEIINSLPEGIITILDAAHSFEQISISITDINPDMAIVNFHKWFGAPIGLGMLYVKPSKVAEIKPLYGSSQFDSDKISKLANFGTLSFPAIMTLNEAFDLQDKKEQPLKTAYLKQLKESWMLPLSDYSKIEFFTPISSDWSASIASFKLKGIDSRKVQKELLVKYKILTVTRKLENEEIIRVTPHWHNDTEQMASLVDALIKISG